MKKLLFLILVATVLSGCTAWKRIQNDYLGGNKYYPSVWKDSWERFLEDYLK